MKKPAQESLKQGFPLFPEAGKREEYRGSGKRAAGKVH
jgi:hypothetical protein